MIEELLRQLTPLQERMHRKSKEKFRNYLSSQAKLNGMSFRIFPKSNHSKNVIIGSLRTAKYIIGAHYDTPPRMPSFLMKNILVFNLLLFASTVALIVLMVLFPLYCVLFLILMIFLFLYPMGLFSFANKYNYNDNTSGILTMLLLMRKIKSPEIAYVFFDNEEKGLLGSMDFAYIMKKHYDMNSKKFIILDCVGRGETFALMSYNSNPLCTEIMDVFSTFKDSGYQFIYRKPSLMEMSDHFSLKRYQHVGIMCYNRQGNKWTIKNIHSHKDRNITTKNIELLSAVLENLIGKGE